ncbi:MAG: hypothetical protein HC888_06805 [Candidatus Competibacteraceae bacterium]|nr:hypothetical protein [Candidatus Competibacteraceae bacterium]
MMIESLKVGDRTFAVTDGTLPLEAISNPQAAPRSVIRRALEERSDGVHVTDLINGARYNWLRDRYPITVDVLDQSAVMAGTAMHKLFESNIHVSMEVDIGGLPIEIVGAIDTVEEYADHIRVIDFKLYGSFAIKKALGLVNNKTTTDRVYRGKPVLQDNWTVDPKAADLRDLSFQLSMYAFMLGKKLQTNKPIQLWAYLIAKDSNNRSARMNGVTKSAYYIPVPRMNESTMLKQVVEKLTQINSKAMPPPCSAARNMGWLQVQKLLR